MKIDDFDPNAHLVETEQALFIGFTECLGLDEIKTGLTDEDADGAVEHLTKLVESGEVDAEESASGKNSKSGKAFLRKLKGKGEKDEEEEEEQEEEDEEEEDD